jgi:hypothetical protein
MKTTLIALATLTVLALTTYAQAGTCTQTCNGYGNVRNCTTVCY